MKKRVVRAPVKRDADPVAFLSSTGKRKGSGDVATLVGQVFLASATSAEDATESVRDEVLLEELGGPFLEMEGKKRGTGLVHARELLGMGTLVRSADADVDDEDHTGADGADEIVEPVSRTVRKKLVTSFGLPKASASANAKPKEPEKKARKKA